MSAIKKTHWLRTTIIVLVLCGIAGLALTGALFFDKPDPTTASATLQLTFDGAAEGIAPNGAQFNTSGIASDEVLTAALESASLSGTYTPEQIRSSLVIRGVYPEDMADKVMRYESLLNFTANRELSVGDFHPTTFSVVLYNDFDKSVSEAQLMGLMEAIMDAYKAYFARVYANGLQSDSPLFELDEYDYPQQLEIIQEHFDTMAQYAQELYESEPAFRYAGVGFNDISVRLNNLINSDISRLNADLTMNALTRDTARLLTQYQFEIRDLSNQLEKQTVQLEKMDKLIDAYDKNEIIYLSTTDALTKIDGNSSETYDSLVDQRKEVADGITQINSQISNYQLKLSDLLKEDATQAAEPSPAASPSATAASSPSEEQSDITTTEDVVAMSEEEIAAAAEEAERLARAQTAALEQNIAVLVDKGDGIIDDFKSMIDAYNAQELNDLTVTVTRMKYDAPKVLSGAFVKKAIKTAGPICAVGFMVCLALIIASRKREERAQ